MRLVGPSMGLLSWGAGDTSRGYAVRTHGGCRWASQCFSDQLCGSMQQKLTLHRFRRPETPKPEAAQGLLHPPGGPENIWFGFSSRGASHPWLEDILLQSSPLSFQLHWIKDPPEHVWPCFHSHLHYTNKAISKQHHIHQEPSWF